MRVLFRTKIFYHSTSIFAIAPSVTLDGPQLHRDFQHNMLLYICSSFIPHKHINRTAPYRSYAVIWCFFVPFNTKKGMRISPMSIISLSHYQTSHPATQARLMPSLEL